MYAVYHGPQGLRAIAQRVHNFTAKLAEGLRQLGFKIAYENFFDTIRVELGQASSSNLIERAERAGCNLRAAGDHAISIALDETTSDFVAGIRQTASVRAGFANFRLLRNVRSTRALARGNYRICRRLFAT